ncbi:CRISPR-associated protein Csn1 [Novosphingobium sp. PC22D]|uniref:superoxide dismutase family protein n=1 Tax=Novosphingobium sp. PC22D TaxID=1962403 RepID=UPI000BEFF69D|nr:superoxide dismutase family protein [Novosphingobium sp. PC22D]PEQ10830.1 CRISPR-associated protein Csn1 [Novosphingobium sp. PC22D]
MTKPTKALALSAIAALIATPALADHHEEHAMADAVASAPIMDVEGNEIGTAKLKQTPTGVLVTVSAKGLSEGEHGFHLHEKGVCDASTKFASAGGHYNPGASEHGLLVKDGPHGGDMPNQYADGSGMLMAEVLNTGVSLDKAAANTIYDADGTALVIHAKADDYMSQPSGAAGDRVACAVVASPK